MGQPTRLQLLLSWVTIHYGLERFWPGIPQVVVDFRFFHYASSCSFNVVAIFSNAFYPFDPMLPCVAERCVLNKLEETRLSVASYSLSRKLKLEKLTRLSSLESTIAIVPAFLDNTLNRANWNTFNIKI